MSESIPQTQCPVNCLENPDAVDKTNWKCNSCGTNLEQAHKDKQQRRIDFEKNIEDIAKKAHNKAMEEYNKVFHDTMKTEEKQN